MSESNRKNRLKIWPCSDESEQGQQSYRFWCQRSSRGCHGGGSASRAAHTAATAGAQSSQTIHLDSIESGLQVLFSVTYWHHGHHSNSIIASPFRPCLGRFSFVSHPKRNSDHLLSSYQRTIGTLHSTIIIVNKKTGYNGRGFRLNYLLRNAAENLGMLGGELREDFAVELKTSLLQLRNEGAV